MYLPLTPNINIILILRVHTCRLYFRISLELHYSSLCNRTTSVSILQYYKNSSIKVMMCCSLRACTAACKAYYYYVLVARQLWDSVGGVHSQLFLHCTSYVYTAVDITSTAYALVGILNYLWSTYFVRKAIPGQATSSNPIINRIPYALFDYYVLICYTPCCSKYYPQLQGAPECLKLLDIAQRGLFPRAHPQRSVLAFWPSYWGLVELLLNWHHLVTGYCFASLRPQHLLPCTCRCAYR